MNSFARSTIISKFILSTAWCLRKHYDLATCIIVYVYCVHCARFNINRNVIDFIAKSASNAKWLFNDSSTMRKHLPNYVIVFERVSMSMPGQNMFQTMPLK